MVLQDHVKISSNTIGTVYCEKIVKCGIEFRNIPLKGVNFKKRNSVIFTFRILIAKILETLHNVKAVIAKLFEHKVILVLCDCLPNIIWTTGYIFKSIKVFAESLFHCNSPTLSSLLGHCFLKSVQKWKILNFTFN